MAQFLITLVLLLITWVRPLRQLWQRRDRRGGFVYIHKNPQAVLCNVTRHINILQ